MLVADQDEGGLVVADRLIIGVGVEAGSDQLAVAAAEPRHELVPAGGRDPLGEKRPHRCPYRFDRKGVGAVIDEDQAAGADRVGSAQDGADISRVAERLSHDPERRLAPIDEDKGGIGRSIHAEHDLGIFLAGYLVKDVGRSLDDDSARLLGFVDQSAKQKVGGIAVEKDLGQNPCFASLGEDPQALGQKESLAATVLLVAQAPRLLDEGI